jgi:hypothetical protein
MTRYVIVALVVLVAAHPGSPSPSSREVFGPWSAPLGLGGLVNSACDEQHPALSNDGLTLVFSSNRPLIASMPCLPALHLWVAQRVNVEREWQRPVVMTPLNSSYDSPYQDHAANLTPDGHWLFFHSTRPGGCNGGGYAELWAAHRRDTRNALDWEAAVNLGCVLNVPAADNAGPNFWEDLTTGTRYLYFTRNLIPADSNGFDIYVTTCAAALALCNRQQLWRSAAYVAELSSPARDTRTAIRRRDGLEMILTSNRAGTAGGLDLWVSMRRSTRDPWSVPVDLNQSNLTKRGVAALNTIADDGAPAMSSDGGTMIFYSNRPGGHGLNDLYVSTRQRLTNP